MGPRGLGLLGLMAWALWLEVVASGDCYDFGVVCVRSSLSAFCSCCMLSLDIDAGAPNS